MKKVKETIHYESSSVASSTYNFQTKELIVEFNGGSQYQYDGVDSSDYEEFSTSESVGKAFNQYIRQYQGKKIEDHVEAN